jgi:hypothetical protein
MTTTNNNNMNADDKNNNANNNNTTIIGWIIGTVKSAADNQPIKNAKVEIYKRLQDKLPDGTPVLRSLEESILIGSTETDNLGQFAVAVQASQNDVFQVVAKAEGFNEVVESMVQLNPNGTAHINFELIPDFENSNISDADQLLSLLREKHERNKLKMYEENPSFHQEIIPEDFHHINNLNLKSTSYSVPDYVKVCNLNGYTGMINVDDFIAGVVSAEMGDAFPYSALKAQAAASRSYSLKRY